MANNDMNDNRQFYHDSRFRNLIKINTFKQVSPTPMVYVHSPLEKEIEITGRPNI